MPTVGRQGTPTRGGRAQPKGARTQGASPSAGRAHRGAPAGARSGDDESPTAGRATSRGETEARAERGRKAHPGGMGGLEDAATRPQTESGPCPRGTPLSQGAESPAAPTLGGARPKGGRQARRRERGATQRGGGPRKESGTGRGPPSRSPSKERGQGPKGPQQGASKTN